MRYEALKDTSLDIIKIKNISNVSKFEYSIEKIKYGKKYHSQNFIFMTNYLYNYLVIVMRLINIRIYHNSVTFINGIKLLNKTNNNVIYKNEKNEMYSNFWWNIYF